METPLTACVSNGRQNCVNLLIAAGTDVNFLDSLRLTPLMHAVVSDQPPIQTLLLYNGADVNSIDHFYETALVKAVICSKFSAAVQLLQQGAELNVLLWGHKTALHRAVEMQHIALTEALVIHGAEVTTEHLIEAAHHGNHHLVRALLTHHKEVKMDERFNGEVPLCVSVWCAHHHCSRVLIKLGADVNALTNYGESTLLGATAHGDYELVKLLLKHGVSIHLVNAKGQNTRMYNLAQNPPVHFEPGRGILFHSILQRTELCTKVYSYWSDINTSETRQALCQKGTTIVNCLKTGHTSSLGQHKFSHQFVCFSARVATSTHVAKDVAK